MLNEKRSDDLLDREFVIVEQLWNGSWEKIDSRLQPTQIALGKVLNTTDLLKLDYTYGVLESGTLNTAKNNGNIQSQTITVPDIIGSNGFTSVQTYTYDSLNRIDDATEMVTPAGSSTATQSWKQDYTFDRYGNRNFVEANTTTIPRNCQDNQSPPNPAICDEDRKIMNPSVNASNNRLSASDGYQFDAAGNTIRDPQFRKFTYDAENKQTKVETVDANGTVTEHQRKRRRRRETRLPPVRRRDCRTGAFAIRRRHDSKTIHRLLERRGNRPRFRSGENV